MDIEGALDKVRPGTLKRWQEYDAREPFGKQWHQVSLIAVTIINAIILLSASMGEDEIKNNIQDMLLDPDAFVPKPPPEGIEEDETAGEQATETLEKLAMDKVLRAFGVR